MAKYVKKFKYELIVMLLTLLGVLTIFGLCEVVESDIVIHTELLSEKDIYTPASKSFGVGSWTNNLSRDVMVYADLYLGMGSGLLSVKTAQTVSAAWTIQDPCGNASWSFDTILAPPAASFGENDPCDVARAHWISHVFRIPDGEPFFLFAHSDDPCDTSISGQLNLVEIGSYLEEDPYVWYVDGTNGDTQNDGKLPGKAFSTIAEALAVDDDGHTIILLPGTYSGQIDLIANAKKITIRGTSKYGSIITTAAAEVTVVMGEGCALDNLTIQNTNTGGGWYCVAPTDAVETNNWSVTNCYIKNADETGIRARFSGGVLIENCIFETSHNCIRLHSSGSAAQRDQVKGNIIRNCTMDTRQSANWVESLIGMNIGGLVVVENCSVNAYRDNAATTATHLTVGMDVASPDSVVTITNCSFNAFSDHVDATAPVRGVMVGGQGDNSVITINGGSVETGADGTIAEGLQDILFASGSTGASILTNGFNYNPTKVTIEAGTTLKTIDGSSTAENLKSSMDKH